MTAFLVLLISGLMYTLGSFRVEEKPGSAGVSLALGYLLLVAYFVGRLFNRAGLPKLTGYIATGIVVGPALLELVNASMLSSLKVVNGVAVALIAMTAGGELDYKAMKPLLRSIRYITLYGVLGSALLLTLAVYFARGALPFMGALTHWEALALSAVLGVVMVAQSPAVVVALRDELEADGVVSRTVLGVVVIADLVVILLFALTSSLAKAVLGGNIDAWHSIRALAWELLGSLVAGTVIGYLLLFAELFPEFGEEAGALTLGVVALNELIAPILYRNALVRSGEAGKKPSSDSAAPAPLAEPVLQPQLTREL